MCADYAAGGPPPVSSRSRTPWHTHSSRLITSVIAHDARPTHSSVQSVNEKTPEAGGWWGASQKMAQWAELEAFTRTIDLDPRVLNGSVTEEVDLQKLYYIYVSSKPDDWNFILQTRGLGRHVKDFAAIEPSWGQHSPAIELPDFDIDQIDHLFDIHRSPDQATQRALHLSKLVVPEVVEIDGVPMHLEIQDFERVMEMCLPTWIEFRKYTALPTQQVRNAAKLAMFADLLEAKAVSANSERLLASVQTKNVQVFAVTETGSVPAAAARALQRTDSQVFYVQPNKLPFRVLDVYNGPVLCARLEERAGHVGMAEVGSSEIEGGPAAGLAQTYVNGVIFDSYSRTGISDAIEQCSTYSQLLKVLLTVGFDLGVPTADSNPRRTTGRCWRIMQGALVVGMICDYAGHMGCLRWQPSVTDFGRQWGAACIYRDDTSDVFIKCWQSYQLCASMRHFREALLEAGLHTVPGK